jgi:predicted GTPase
MYYPGETNFRRAQVLVINKMDSAEKDKLDQLLDNIQQFNPDATIIRANSTISVPEGKDIAGKTVLVVDDGPTLTHGGMPYGAGILAATQYGASKIIDPRPYAVGSIKDTLQKYSHLDKVLPAMGYGKKQTDELAQTIDQADCDLVVSGTPIDLGRLIKTNKRILRVTYALEEIGSPNLKEVLKEF